MMVVAIGVAPFHYEFASRAGDARAKLTWVFPVGAFRLRQTGGRTSKPQANDPVGGSRETKIQDVAPAADGTAREPGKNPRPPKNPAPPSPSHSPASRARLMAPLPGPELTPQNGRRPATALR